MSLQQGLSGLNAASRNLDVIGNNIANANTIGGKASRAEFSDIYASVNASGASTAGLGVNVAAVSQSFSQGNLTSTGNALDMAINGNGFFQLTQPDGSTAYSRNGQFKLDQNGYVVSNNGSQLMGFATDTTGKRVNSSPGPLQLPTGKPIAPKATGSVSAELNLNAATPAATASTPITSIGTSLNAYDSQGAAVPVGLYFVKTATANTWDVYSSDQGNAPTKIGGLSFNTDGSLKETLDASGAPTGANTLPFTVASSGGAATPQNLTVDFSNSTQFGSAFGVSKLTQDGWAPGQLTSITVGDDGVISARYSNGQTQAAGQVALANFRNPQGLIPMGGNNWAETMTSGQPSRGAPGESGLGGLQSGSLEESNVDLTAELVNMMTAQRAYQANAQTIKTQDQIMSTLMNMR